MKIKASLIIIIGSLLLQVLLSPIRGFINLEYSSVIGFLTYFFLAALLHRKFGKMMPCGLLIIYIIAGILIIQLPVRITAFSTSLFTLPDMICHILGAFTYYLFIQLKNPIRFILFGIMFSIPIFMAVFGYEMWQNKLSNNTFTGRVFLTEKVSFEGFTESGKKIDQSTFHNKWVLFDFWFIGCKPCYDGFPQLEKIYKKYKENPNVMVSAVDLPMKEDALGDSFYLLKRLNYTFPNFVIKIKGKTNPFDIISCPTTILINKKGEVVFKGNLIQAELLLQERLKVSE